MIRAFVAISIPREILEGIETVSLRLKERGIDARFTKTDAIHLTLKFLGNVDEAGIAQVKEALDRSVQTADPFSLNIEGLGVFPDLRKPRIVWIGIEETPALLDLQQQVELNLKLVGFQEEQRPFKPHLTLARLKSSRNLSQLEHFLLSEGATTKLGAFRVNAIHLYQSVLRPDGAEYRQLSNHVLSLLESR